MTVTIFYESDGMISYYAESSSLGAPDIAEMTPVGGGYIISDDYPDMETQYVVDGALVDRPTVTEELNWTIRADGTESAWFWAPAGTTIWVTADGQDILLNGADAETTDDVIVTFNSTIAAEFMLDVAPPFPYRDIEINVTAGERDEDDPAPLPVPTHSNLTFEGMRLTFAGLQLTFAGVPKTSVVVSQPIPTGLVGKAKPKFNKWKWDESADPRHDYWELTFYSSFSDAENDVNGTLISPIYENFYQDVEDREIDDGLWARLADVDIGWNRSIKSEVATLTARGVETADVALGAITTVAIAETDGAATITGSYSQMQTITASWDAAAEVTIFFEFRIPTNEDINLQFRSGGEVLVTKAFRAGAELNSFYMDSFESGAASGVAITAWMKLQASGSADVYSRKLAVIATNR